MKRVIRRLLAGVWTTAAVIGLSAATAAADWQTDIGYSRLADELGEDLPDGAGVSVCQAEAAVQVGEAYTWMPDPDNAALAGQTINDRSGAPDGIYSGHATSVARLLCGIDLSMAAGIDSVDVYYAGHWLEGGYLRYGYSYPPAATTPRLANHSWVGAMTTSAADGEVLRRLDWAVDRDEYLQTVGLTNSAASTRPLLASAFNVMAVGRTDGSHSRGSAGVDVIYTAGRVRPDLVAPMTTTSAAAPVVGSAAALLMQAGHDQPALSTDPVETSTTSRSGLTIYNAERAEVIRAALAAGADRYTRNTTTADIVDYRLDAENQTDNGLDLRYGAGQLNIYNSYHILVAGEQNSNEDGGGIVGHTGFDYDPAFGGEAGCNDTATYTLTADGEHNLLTVALVWHLRIDGGSGYSFDGTATRYDLDLELYDITAGAVVAQSMGSADNSEHLWVSLTPGHDYDIRVQPGTGQAAFTWDYALAWTTRADADQDRIPDDVDNCRLTANRPQTDADGDGDGNRCDCDLDNNDRVDLDDYWRWRIFATIDPQSDSWVAAIDFNDNGVADADDYAILLNRFGQAAPYE